MADTPDSAPPTPDGEGQPSKGPDLTDSMELVHRFQGGDDGAMNELFQRYWPRLRRVVRIRMGGDLRGHCEPEDIVQETLVVAMGKLHELQMRSPSSILQWLSRIAEFQIKNKRGYFLAQRRDPRRERRLQANDPTSSGVVGFVVPADGPTPSQVLSRHEMEEIVDLCVEELEPDDYREVILHRDYYDADWEAVREELGRPTLAAAQELHRRARAKLRESLGRRLGG